VPEDGKTAFAKRKFVRGWKEKGGGGGNSVDG